MASSRASSPNDGSEPGSPSQLTPRSKVKAMLAALDVDSDSENPRLVREDLSKPSNGLLESQNTVLEDVKSTSNNDEEEDEEDDDDLFRPRGRLAGRMQPGHSDNDSETGNTGKTARDRVRKMLLEHNKISPKPNSITQHKESDSSNHSPINSRKRKLRAGNHPAPRSSASSENGDSPGGMFVSPGSRKSASPAPDAQHSDDDLPANPNANSRFLALVEKARRARQAKEAEIARRKSEQALQRAQQAADHDALIAEDYDDEGSDEDVERQLTQQVRPTRKASKKALEEMHKETQRMSRNMQLAHEARTKKKITKSSLFARFNYHPAGYAANESSTHDRSAGSSSPVHSDAGNHDTPPTSPLTQSDDAAKTGATNLASLANEITTGPRFALDDEEDIPSLDRALSQDASIVVDKGKAKAVDAAPHIGTPEAVFSREEKFPKISIRVHPPMSSKINSVDDSDSDLEIEGTRKTPRKMAKDSIFDRISAKQTGEFHSLQVLRMLAQQTSSRTRSDKRIAKPSMTAGELHASLQRRARQQALHEREERLQALRDRGIIIPTAEEKEKEMVEVDNLIEKARREAQEITKREKAAAKKDNKTNENEDNFGESEDEDWEEGAQDILPSGSEDGENEGEDDGDESDEDAGSELSEGEDRTLLKSDNLIDEEALACTSDEDDDHDLKEADTDDPFVDDNTLPVAQSRRRIKKNVISDDEDEDEAATAPKATRLSHLESPATHTSDPVHAPSSVLRSATKTFIPGLSVSGPAGLGLTQIFAGTMDESQLDEQSQPFPDRDGDLLQRTDEAQDSLAFLRHLPAPELPEFKPTMDEDSQDIVQDSQTQASGMPSHQSASYESQAIQLEFSQSVVHGFDSLVDDVPNTQLSEYPEPTQDAGFQDMTPIRGRFVEPPPSTVDTVVREQTPRLARVSETPVVETPIAKKKGRLQRKIHVADLSDDDDVVPRAASPGNADETDIETHPNAFNVLRQTPKRQNTAVVDFDKNKSGAKEMVHEQAEESEDEYAGLGGNSDDESGGEEDAFVREMIDDEDGQDVDERQLAAFYADKERANDEKAVEKLFKDITNGTLRRKRGANYDLSDSDDDGEARRRRKQKEFAKMRKALLEDERIGKIAENPKRLAFLRAIEDRDDNEGELDFLDDFVASEGSLDSQSQSQAEDSQQDTKEANNSQPGATMGPPKRKLSASATTENRVPPNLRRTKPTKKPSTLSEIRESLSCLIDEPNAVEAAAQDSSDSDLEIEGVDGESTHRMRDKENKDPFASRRSNKTAVVDRISLKRASSISAPASNTARLAFATSSSTAPGFKVPALLRRATTNSSLSSVSSSSSSASVSGMERMSGGLGVDSRAVAKKAGKNSGVNYFARENERRIKVQEAEKRREEKRFRGAEGRRKVVGGLFGMGKFE